MATETGFARASLTLLQAVAIAALVPSLVSCQTTANSLGPDPDSGFDTQGNASLQLRLALDPVDALGFSRVSIVPDWAGANIGPERDSNWTQVPVAEGPLEVGTRADLAPIASMGELPAGSYDRVFVAAEEVRGQLDSGDWVSLANHIEPIARGFEVLAGEHATVTIDLVVLAPSSQGDGRYEIFVKDAGPADYGAAPWNDAVEGENE